jgi:hypothetical protein
MQNTLFVRQDARLFSATITVKNTLFVIQDGKYLKVLETFYAVNVI